MGYQSNILNWRMQRGPEIGTDHTPIILTISTNLIKIRTKARDNYNLADWKLFQVHTIKWENVELDGKNTEEINRVTRKLIQHITEARNKAIPQKYETLPHPENQIEIVNIRDETHQLNQQIEVMGCNRWQFQELHRLGQERK